MVHNKNKNKNIICPNITSDLLSDEVNIFIKYIIFGKVVLVKVTRILLLWWETTTLGICRFRTPVLRRSMVSPIRSTISLTVLPDYRPITVLQSSSGIVDLQGLPYTIHPYLLSSPFSSFGNGFSITSFVTKQGKVPSTLLVRDLTTDSFQGPRKDLVLIRSLGVCRTLQYLPISRFVQYDQVLYLLLVLS